MLDKLELTTPEKKLVVENCIAFLRVGSQLYGTNSPNSDEDFVGVYIEPEEYRVGRKRCEFVEFKSNPSSSGKRNQKGDLDCTFYGLDKWFGLLAGNNPNQLELLFVNQGNVLHKTEAFDKVIANRHLFISKKLKHSFAGYAYSQLERNKVKSGNQTGRKDLIEKFGFDPKLLSHALRLYVESYDLLVRGEIEFPLYNNQELLDIKQGLVPYEKFQERCAFYEPLIEKAYIESKLPHSPDLDGISKLQVELYNQHWGK
jgi:predicted nucleotidyltransferase